MVKIKRMLLALFDKILMFVFQKIYGVQDKYAVFESFVGAQYSDNPRAISEKLYELDPEYVIVWLLKNMDEKYGIIPSYVKKVRYTRVNRVREIAKCSVYVTNEDIKPGYYKNKKKQFYIQTWHGDRPLKKILYEVCDNLYPPVVDNKYTNLCIAGSKFGEKIYREAFRYNGEILNLGSPKNDKLVIRDIANEKSVIKKLKLNGKKILLYAPTFRDNSSSKSQNVNVDILSILNLLEKKYSEKWVALMRAHPSQSKLNGINNDKILDVSDYPDMADLLAISDILITDYSSSCNDYVLTYKPIILCHYDKEEYIKNHRELKFNPVDAGYIIANNQKELENILLNYKKKDYENSCKKIMKFFEVTETGKSSEKICKIINKWQCSKK